MSVSTSQFDLSKSFARRLLTMIETRLVTYKQFEPWADAAILAFDRPPYWILDLAITSYSQEAAGIVREYAYSEPFEAFDREQITDEGVACYLLRHLRRETSWATFLSEAGDLSDGSAGRHQCEYFYDVLNESNDSGYAEKVERRQREIVEREYGDVILVVQVAYDAVACFARLKSSSATA